MTEISLTQMADRLETVEIRNHRGLVVGRLGMKMYVMFKGQTDLAKRRSLMELINLFREWVGPQEFGWWASSMTGKVHLEKTKKFDPDALFAIGRNPNREFSIALTSVADPDMEARKVTDNAQRFMIHAFARELELDDFGHFQVHFPVSWALQQPAGRKPYDFLLLCCEKLKPIQGSFGLSMQFPLGRVFNRGPASARVLRPYLVELPGLLVGSAGGHQDKGLDTINWITVVHDEWLQKLGGREKVMEKCTAPLKATPWSEGLIIKAGEDPMLGDPSQPQFNLPAYFEAAKLLRPLRHFKDYSLYVASPSNGAPQDWLTDPQAWLERFDRPYAGDPNFGTDR